MDLGFAFCCQRFVVTNPDDSMLAVCKQRQAKESSKRMKRTIILPDDLDRHKIGRELTVEDFMKVLDLAV